MAIQPGSSSRIDGLLEPVCLPCSKRIIDSSSNDGWSIPCGKEQGKCWYSDNDTEGNEEIPPSFYARVNDLLIFRQQIRAEKRAPSSSERHAQATYNMDVHTIMQAEKKLETGMTLRASKPESTSDFLALILAEQQKQSNAMEEGLKLQKEYLEVQKKILESQKGFATTMDYLADVIDNVADGVKGLTVAYREAHELVAVKTPSKIFGSAESQGSPVAVLDINDLW